MDTVGIAEQKDPVGFPDLFEQAYPFRGDPAQQGIPGLIDGFIRGWRLVKITDDGTEPGVRDTSCFQLSDQGFKIHRNVQF